MIIATSSTKDESHFSSLHSTPYLKVCLDLCLLWDMKASPYKTNHWDLRVEKRQLLLIHLALRAYGMLYLSVGMLSF